MTPSITLAELAKLPAETQREIANTILQGLRESVRLRGELDTARSRAEIAWDAWRNSVAVQDEKYTAATRRDGE